MEKKETLSNQNRIKQLRLEQHKTQKEVGKAVGLSDRAIAHYERGIREPKLETWVKLANFFDVPVSYLQGISNISDKATFNDLETWLSVVGKPVDNKRVSISRNELESRTQELTLTMFNNAFNSLINAELFARKSDQEKFNKIKNTLSIDDLGAMQDIVGLANYVFKIGLEALDNKKAKIAYDALYKIAFNYFGIDEEGLLQDGDTIRHKKS